MSDNEIIRLLRDAREKALATFSNFHVGAVIVTEDDQLIAGFNIESSSYGLTICAERVALFKALSEGYRRFKEIHILCDDSSPCPPCGACRQVLMDYAPDIKVVMHAANGEKREQFLKELLPYAFTPENLKKK